MNSRYRHIQIVCCDMTLRPWDQSNQTRSIYRLSVHVDRQTQLSVQFAKCDHKFLSLMVRISVRTARALRFPCGSAHQDSFSTQCKTNAIRRLGWIMVLSHTLAASAPGRRPQYPTCWEWSLCSRPAWPTGSTFIIIKPSSHKDSDCPLLTLCHMLDLTASVSLFLL